MTLRALRGSFAYEYRMQVRRPAVWVVLLLVAAAVIAGTRAPFRMDGGDLTMLQVAGDWALKVQALLPAAFGCLLADRLQRERRLRVDELLAALPAGAGARLVGKYLGGTLATLLPILLVYAAGVAYLAVARGPAVLPAALGAFAAVTLPGLLFVAAFSIGCPALMPVPLYQFLFVGYWFWGNFLGPGFHIPTISQTILTPLGPYALRAFFHTRATISGAIPVSAALESIALMLALAAVALWATWRYLALQRLAA